MARRAPKTHLVDAQSGRTYCGRLITETTLLNPPRANVEEATCLACGRVDESRQIRDYRRECKAAGVEP